MSERIKHETEVLSTTELELLLTNEEMYRTFSQLYMASSSYVITANAQYETQFTTLINDVNKHIEHLNTFGTNEERDQLIAEGGQWITSVQQDVFPLVDSENRTEAVPAYEALKPQIEAVLEGYHGLNTMRATNINELADDLYNVARTNERAIIISAAIVVLLAIAIGIMTANVYSNELRRVTSYMKALAGGD